MLPNFYGKVFKEEGKVGITTTEGRDAVEEVIKYLEAATEAPKLRRLDGESKDDKEPWKVAPITGTAALKANDKLTSACKDHVEDTGPTGVEGHTGADKSTVETRIAKYGGFNKIATETMAYGQITGVNVIRSILVDDGVSSRENRYRIFNPDLKEVGIYSGTHNTHGHQSCLLYVDEFVVDDT